MSKPAGPGFETSTATEDCIVLVMVDGRDRDLLVDWLGSFPRYRVQTATAPPDLPDEYDLCFISRELLDEFRQALQERSKAEGTLYLPHVVAVPTGSDDPGVDTGSDSFITDIVTLPVEKAILHRRLENLLQARRASVRLAERQHQYRQLVELTPETILLLEDGDIVYANEAAASLFDVEDPTVIEGYSLLSFVDADDEADLQKLLAGVEAEDSDTDSIEVRMRSKTGQPRYVAITGVTVMYGGRPMKQLVIRDLTRKKEREQRLTLFGRAMESAAQGITIADADQDDMPLIYANQGFEQITGYTVDEILGQNCRFLQGENTDPKRVTEIREAIESEQPVSVELLNYRKDGSPFWNRLDIVPVEDNNGEVTHYLGLQRDITEQKEREQKLSVLNRVLRHNLRNKMNVIQVYADQLERGEGSTDAIAAIQTAVDELLTISDQIRKFDSIIATNKQDLKEIDLLELVEDSLTGLHDRSPETTVELTAPETALILAHETLRPALTDLIALTDAVESPEFTVDITTTGEEVVLKITDQSDSLDPRDLEIIAGDIETPLEHLQSLELWLIRWAVEASHGEFTVDLDGEFPTVIMRFLHPVNNPPE